MGYRTGHESLKKYISRYKTTPLGSREGPNRSPGCGAALYSPVSSGAFFFFFFFATGVDSASSTTTGSASIASLFRFFFFLAGGWSSSPFTSGSAPSSSSAGGFFFFFFFEGVSVSSSSPFSWEGTDKQRYGGYSCATRCETWNAVVCRI